MSQISNQATVIKVKGNIVVAEVESKSACLGCSVQKSCYIKSCASRIIEIPCDHASTFVPGETVTVYMEQSCAWKAVIYAYILPLLLVITTIVTSILWGMEDIVAALYGLMVLIPYYLILYISKVWIKRRINFSIVKGEQDE